MTNKFILTITAFSAILFSNILCDSSEYQDDFGSRSVGLIEKSNFPCPEPDDIKPCICTFDGDYNMFMDCSTVYDEEVLRYVFAHEFSFYNFEELLIDQIENKTHLNRLSSGVFDLSTFHHINLFDTILQFVEPDIFDRMKDELKSLYLYNSSLTDLMFNFSNFTLIAECNFILNPIESFELSSPTLEEFSLTYSNLVADDFNDTSDALEVQLNNNNFDKVPDVTNFVSLQSMNLDDNSITSLIDGDLCVSANLSYLSIKSNGLSAVEPNSVCVANGSEIYLNNNLLEYVEESAWGEVIPNINTGAFYLDDNPLKCGCDLAWLFIEDYSDRISSGTICVSGDYFYELDPIIFLNLC